MPAAYIVPVVYLAEQLAHAVEFVTQTLHGSETLSGTMIGLLVATPEASGAVRAVLA
jgi:Ca2+:H+ antiporter